MKVFLEHLRHQLEWLLVQRPWAVLGGTMSAGVMAGLTLSRAIF